MRIQDSVNRRAAVVILAVLLAGLAVAGPERASAAQATAAQLEERAYRLGVEAARAAQGDPANAEEAVAARYREVLALASDEATGQRLKEAFARGYRSEFAAQPAASGSPAGPRLADITTARGVAMGKPVDPAEVFTPDTNPIYVWFRYQGVAAGAVISSVWYYLELPTPLRISDATLTVQPPTDWVQFNLELAPGKRWPAGAYRVELLVDGRVLGEARFSITPGAAGEADRRYRHPRAAFEVTVPSGWLLDDQVASADLQLKAEQGDGLIEITSGPTSGNLDPISYAAGWESVSVGPGKRLVAKRAGRPLMVNGEPAYEGVYEGQDVLAKVIFVARPNRFVVVTGVFGRDAFAGHAETFDRMVQSLTVLPMPARVP